ncbi:MAG: hypothetical protein ACI9G1_003918 [Pirellulaceae bacterium]|jgi:hypothetical protein
MSQLQLEYLARNIRTGESKIRLFLPVLIVAATLLACPVQGEVPLLAPAELQKEANHIVTATVQNIYTTEKVLDNKHVDTLYAVEVAISGVEKGDAIAANQIIFAKAWQMKQRGKDWAGPSGQELIPKKGQVVKLFLTGSNGNYTALSPNGIRLLKTKDSK